MKTGSFGYIVPKSRTRSCSRLGSPRPSRSIRNTARPRRCQGLNKSSTKRKSSRSSTQSSRGTSRNTCRSPQQLLASPATLRSRLPVRCQSWRSSASGLAVVIVPRQVAPQSSVASVRYAHAATPAPSSILSTGQLHQPHGDNRGCPHDSHGVNQLERSSFLCYPSKQLRSRRRAPKQHRCNPDR